MRARIALIRSVGLVGFTRVEVPPAPNHSAAVSPTRRSTVSS